MIKNYLDQLSSEHVLTCICVSEFVFTKEIGTEIGDFVDNRSVSDVRERILQIGVLIEDAYDKFTGKSDDLEGLPFDLEVVPFVLDNVNFENATKKDIKRALKMLAEDERLSQEHDEAPTKTVKVKFIASTTARLEHVQDVEIPANLKDSELEDFLYLFQRDRVDGGVYVEGSSIWDNVEAVIVD